MSINLDLEGQALPLGQDKRPAKYHPKRISDVDWGDKDVVRTDHGLDTPLLVRVSVDAEQAGERLDQIMIPPSGCAAERLYRGRAGYCD